MELKKILCLLIVAAGSIFILTYWLNFFTVEVLVSIGIAFFFFCCLLLGGFLLSVTFFFKNEILNRLSGWLATGLIFVTGWVFLVALLKILNPFSLLVLLILPGLAIFKVITNSDLKKKFFWEVRRFFLRPAGELIIFLLPFAYSLTPIVFYDSLVYGPGVANFIWQNGGFVPARFQLFYNLTIYNELFLVPLVALDELSIHIFQVLLAVVFLLDAADFGREKLGIRAKNLFLVVVVFLPLNMFLIVSGKTDLPAAFFLFLAIKASLENYVRSSALFFGFAAGIKPFSIVALPIFLIIEGISKRKIFWKKYLQIGLIVFCILAPLILKNYLFTGNPFFPFFNKIFPVEGWDHSRLLILKSEVGRAFQQIGDLISFLFTLSFNEFGAGGFIGPLFLVVLPFLIFITKEVRNWTLLSFALLYILFGGLLGRAIRYQTVAFLLLAYYVVLVAEKIERKRVVMTMLALIAFINFLVSWAMVESVSPLRGNFIGQKGYDFVLRAQFPAYEVFQLINRQTSPAARILIAGETRGLYLHRPYQIGTAYNYSVLKPFLEKSHSGDEFWKKIKDEGFDYLMIDFNELKRLQNYKMLSSEEEKKLFEYVQQRKPNYFSKGIVLFAL